MGQEIRDINGGTVKSPLDGTERIEIQEAAGGAGSTKQTTTQAIANLSGTWGSITGTLSNQTDLIAELALKAPLASPALTGTPTVPTASPGTNTTQAASTAFVQASVSRTNSLFLYNNFI